MTTDEAVTTADELGSDTQTLQSSDDIFQEMMSGENSENQTQETDEKAGDTIPEGIEVAGEKFSVPDLEELITLGKDAKEVKAESTRRFQDAAKIREELGPWAQLKDAWATGDPGTRRKIIDFFSGEVGDGSAQQAPTQTQASNLPDLEKLTDNERAIHDHAEQRIARLEATIERLSSAVVPALEDVKGFVGQTKAERQNVADASEIEALHGVKVTPQDVAEMRSKGISNPVQAFEYMKDKLGAAFQKGAQTAQTKQEEVKSAQAPTQSKAKTFDSSKMSGDEIAILTAQGWVSE